MYERIFKIVSGPLSAAIGVGSTAVVHADVTKQPAVNVATFVGAAAVSTLPHLAWFRNLAIWWNHEYDQFTPEEQDTIHDAEDELRARFETWFNEKLESVSEEITVETPSVSAPIKPDEGDLAQDAPKPAPAS